MSSLHQLESKSIYLIREAFKTFGDHNMAILWSMGKDSTTLLWLVRKAFLGQIPFPVVHIDTSYKFPQMYEYRSQVAAEWNLDLHIEKNEGALNQGMSKASGNLKCCNALKTMPFKNVVDALKLKAVLLAIRRDEHGVRAKERYVSPRNAEFKWDYKNQPLEMWDQFADYREEQETHLRIHPLLDWTELDIWRYIETEDIPVIDMYFSKNGKRYRSIGCAPCTEPVPSEATTVAEIINELENTTTAERQGRAQDKENEATMQKLRALGYM